MSKRMIVDPPEARQPEAPEEFARTPWWRPRFIYFVAAFLIVCGIFTGGIAYRMIRSGPQSGGLVGSVVNLFVPEPQALFGKDRIYVMLLGLDYDYTTTDQPMSKQSRSDVIDIFGLDFPSHAIHEVAVPRDMAATFNGHEQKINGAVSAGGVKLADQVIGSFIGLPLNEHRKHFDRYVVLRINATREFIDAIGGIDVPVTETMNYDDNWGHLHIHFKPGLQHMNGEQAVGYARFRHDACSDPCRIKRRQQVLRIAIEKLKNDKFGDLTHIGALIGVANRNIETNLTDDEKKSLAWHFRDINLADLKSAQVPFSGDKVSDYAGDLLVPDEAGKRAVLATLTQPYSVALPPPDAAALASVVPSSLHVDVRNGSGVTGLGRHVADVLRKQGYNIASIGDADSSDYAVTEIHPHINLGYAGERLRKDLGLSAATVTPQAQTSPAPSAGEQRRGDVTVVVGHDYAQAQARTPSLTASKS